MTFSTLLALVLIVEPGGLSLNEALAKIRASRAAGDGARAVVTVRGINRINAPVLFTEADHDIDFVGERDATISGGVRVRGWKDVGEGVWEADAPRDSVGKVRFFDQLWVGGRRVTFARLPKDDAWMRIFSASQTVVSVVGSTTNYLDIVKLDDASAKVLASVPKEDYPFLEAGIVCKWCYGLRTLTEYDAKTDTVRFLTKFPWQNWKIWDRRTALVCFLNVRSAFTEPGECFLDMKAGKLRYRPLPGENVPSLDIVAPTPGQNVLVTFRGDWKNERYVRNVTFRNIAFEHAGSGLDGVGPEQLDMHQSGFGSAGAIRLEGTRNVRFRDCRIAHTSGYGMRLHSACCGTQVTHCKFTDVGTGGLRIGAEFNSRAPEEGIKRLVLLADRPDATAFNDITDCEISIGGRYNPEGVGIAVCHASDTRVLHNDIHDFYYSGISVGWVWGFWGSVAQRNDIGYNRIWDLGKGLMSDLAGIYTLSTSYGTRVHHNVVHDVKCGLYGGWGLYADEGSEGIVFEKNLVWNTETGGFFQHFGTGCLVRNNILMFNTREDEAALTPKWKKKFGTPCSLDVVNNIIGTRTGLLTTGFAAEVPGVWANNLWWDCRGMASARFGSQDWEAWRASRRETGGVFADPLFVNADKLDFRLQPDSPALKLGFEPWDYTTAGIREDATAKIQAAIDAAAERGGGEVTVVSGEYRISSLSLRSGVTLRLAKNARLFASRDIDDYPRLRNGRPRGVVDIRGAHDVAIVGEPGCIIDGGNCYDPNEGAEGYRGPHAIWVVESTNVTVRGVTVRDSANYAVEFHKCRDTRVEDMTAIAGHDGIHHDLCDGVRVFGCSLFTGDDSLAGACCTDVIISNCALSSACSPIRYGGRDILITDCRVTSSPYPHRWTLTDREKCSGAGPDAVGGRRSTGCLFQTYTGDRPVAGFRPGNIVLRNITCEWCDRLMVSLSGVPGAIWQNGVGIPDVTFENVRAKWIRKPSVVVARDGEPMRLTFRNCSIMHASLQPCAFFGKNVTVVNEGVTLENVDGPLFETRGVVTYDDIPEFPSWRLETAETRKRWGLPPVREQPERQRFRAY